MASARDIALSTASAQNQMQFQERMSNTAHVREIQDLKNAGLNPVLSARLGGASTPSGAEGDYSDPNTGKIIEALKTSVKDSGAAVKEAVEGIKSISDITAITTSQAFQQMQKMANLEDKESDYYISPEFFGFLNDWKIKGQGKVGGKKSPVSLRTPEYSVADVLSNGLNAIAKLGFNLRHSGYYSDNQLRTMGYVGVKPINAKKAIGNKVLSWIGSKLKKVSAKKNINAKYTELA